MSLPAYEVILPLRRGHKTRLPAMACDGGLVVRLSAAQQHARTPITPKRLNTVAFMGAIRMIEALEAVSDIRDRPESALPRHCDQYWSALMISPPARVTRAAINWTDATSLMKWTEPSTNRALAPPGWNE